MQQLIPIVSAYWNAMGLSLPKQEQLIEGFDQSVYPLSETSILSLLEQVGLQKIIRFYTGLWVSGWLAFKG